MLLLEREAQLACLGEYAAEAVTSRAAAVAQRHRDGSPREAGRRGYRRVARPVPGLAFAVPR